MVLKKHNASLYSTGTALWCYLRFTTPVKRRWLHDKCVGNSLRLSSRTQLRHSLQSAGWNRRRMHKKSRCGAETKKKPFAKSCPVSLDVIAPTLQGLDTQMSKSIQTSKDAATGKETGPSADASRSLPPLPSAGSAASSLPLLKSKKANGLDRSKTRQRKLRLELLCHTAFTVNMNAQ